MHSACPVPPIHRLMTCDFRLFSHSQGTVRRKKKVIHRTATTDDKKLQNTLKKLTVNPIPGIEEVSHRK